MLGGWLILFGLKGWKSLVSGWGFHKSWNGYDNREGKRRRLQEFGNEECIRSGPLHKCSLLLAHFWAQVTFWSVSLNTLTTSITRSQNVPPLMRLSVTFSVMTTYIKFCFAHGLDSRTGFDLNSCKQYFMSLPELKFTYGTCWTLCLMWNKCYYCCYWLSMERLCGIFFLGGGHLYQRTFTGEGHLLLKTVNTVKSIMVHNRLSAFIGDRIYRKHAWGFLQCHCNLSYSAHEGVKPRSCQL